jgi:hypothetical protein
LIRHGPHKKRRLFQFFVAVGTCLPSHCLAAVGRSTNGPTSSHLIRNGLHRKRRLFQFFVAAGMYLPSHCLAAVGRSTDSPLIRNGPRRKRRGQQFFCVSCKHVAAGTFLPSRCLVPLRGLQITATAPPRHRRFWGGGFMKYAIEMGSGAMMYILSHSICVTVDGVWIGDWILLTTHTHDWELQAVTAPPLISTVHKSPQHPLSLFEPMSSPAVPWKRLLKVEILQLHELRFCLHSLS